MTETGLDLAKLVVPAGMAKELIRKLRPNCFALYSAGWAAGFTVNHIPATA